MTGTVLHGSWNIFTVRAHAGAAGVYACRLKGKVLRAAQGAYNPLAPGDEVVFEPDPARPGTGRILEARPRRSAFTRTNQKGAGPGGSAQVLAANVDQVLVMTSPGSPPFRPRFIDRVLAQAEQADLPAVILVNKADLWEPEAGIGDGAGADTAGEVQERLRDFERIGYRVCRVSARTGAGLAEVREILAGRASVLLGQSGVGKSSLIHALAPEVAVRIGALNDKYDRGNHTTTLSVRIDLPGLGGSSDTWIIDTPGIRRFVPWGMGPDTLARYFRDFAAPALACTFGPSCTHRNEPGCGIRAALAAGTIHPDRYESFLRLQEDLRTPSRSGA